MKPNLIVSACVTSLLLSISSTSIAEESNTKDKGLYLSIQTGLRTRSKQNYQFAGAQFGGYDVGRYFAFDETWAYGLGLGYRFNKKFRTEFQFKKMKADIPQMFTSTRYNPNTRLNIDAYNINLYRDINIKGSPFVPYFGAGVGIANVYGPLIELDAGGKGSSYKQLMAGVSYKKTNYDIFSEVSYGGIGKTTHNMGHTPHVELRKYQTLEYTIGVRVKL